jgi:predicted transglutaminase-like cysteine proteinase
VKKFLLIILCLALLAPLPALGRPPAGYQIFCEHHRKMCKYTGNAEIDYSEKLLSELVAVNKEINQRMRARPDPGLDVWSINVTEGDCEDFALAKRAKLLAKYPGASAALRIAVGKIKSSGERHAVLVVNTTKGEYVLDMPNFAATVTPIKPEYAGWEKLGKIN